MLGHTDGGTVKASMRRGATTLASAVVVLGLGAVPASADTWREPEAWGDVEKTTYSAEPEPCGTLTRTVDPLDADTDIVALSARHTEDVVEMSVRFRDLTRWGQRASCPSISRPIVARSRSGS